MAFENQKQKYLDALYKPDKSKKGNVDERISSLIDCLNEKENYVTTSSCSGRVDLLQRPKDSKKYEAAWPYVTHGVADSNDVFLALEKCVVEKPNADVWLKMEAPILHVMCRTVDDGIELVKIAKQVGFKYSGIFSIKDERVMVEIMACEKMETLVGRDGEILVTNDYIHIAVGEANEKLALAHKRLDALFILCKEL